MKAHALSAIALFAIGTAVQAQDIPTPPAEQGTVAYNEWLGRTFVEELLNEQDPGRRDALLEVLVAEDYIQHNPLVPEGRAGLAAFIPVAYASIPNSEFTLHDVFATEDRVVARWTWTGTLSGEPFLGVEATGQELEFDAIDIWTVENGMLARHWDQFDWPRAFVQMGVEGLPAPFYAVAAQPVDR